MRILKRNEAVNKIQTLSTLVKQTIKKERKKEKFDLEWELILERQLYVGCLIHRGDGNIMQFYTLRGQNSDYQDLSGFKAVDIVLIGKYDGPINRLSDNGEYKGLAESIDENFKRHGYNSRVRKLD
jgi:hypothetical protein